MPMFRRTRIQRGFTLVELIVTILIVGILASLALVGYATYTDSAQGARAQADLAQVATSVVAQATVTGATQLDRTLVSSALEQNAGVNVTQGITAGATWRLGYAGQSPIGPNDLSVGFDNGDGNGENDGGRRAVLEMRGGKQTYARIIWWDGTPGTGGTVPDGTTPIQVLTNPVLIGHGGAPAPQPAAPQDLTRDPAGTLTWGGDPGAGGTWCVDFLVAGTWARQGCTTANTWPGAPGTGNYTVYWRPSSNVASSGLFCPALTITQDWGTDPANPAFGAWVSTSGVPSTYDWSQLTVSAAHYAAGNPATPVDTDPDVYASASGWLNHVLFTGGANAPAGGLVPGDIYVLTITGPGVYSQGCALGFTATAAPTSTNGVSGWTSQPVMHVWWQYCGTSTGCDGGNAGWQEAVLQFASTPPTYHQASGTISWTSSTPLVAPSLGLAKSRPILVPVAGGTYLDDGAVKVQLYCDYYDDYFHAWHTNEACGNTGQPVRSDVVASAPHWIPV